MNIKHHSIQNIIITSSFYNFWSLTYFLISQSNNLKTKFSNYNFLHHADIAANKFW